MKTVLLHPEYHQHTEEAQNTVDIIDFYNKATEDYAFWSKDLNMHFGYFHSRRTNPFKRDSMLNEMNRQVLGRLRLPPQKALLADLGCGMGGTMRYALERHKNLAAFGITLSEFQAKEGNRLFENRSGTIFKGDFNNTFFASNTFDGAVAIESFCHSGHSKSSFQEAYRILKPGGRLVIADAFLKKSPKALCYSSKIAYRKLCDHWSLERLGTIDKIMEQLKAVGFSEVIIENISFRVAPSVLHVPFAILGFLLQKLWNTRHLKKASLHNLKGSFYALLSGLHLNSFGYYLITCKKQNQ